jgi:hypothetical protein
MNDTSELVDALISLDGSERWKLYRNSSGLYSATVATFGRGALWTGKNPTQVIGQRGVPGYVSGPFDPAEAAQHAALDDLPWFFEALISNPNGS